VIEARHERKHDNARNFRKNNGRKKAQKAQKERAGLRQRHFLFKKSI